MISLRFEDKNERIGAAVTVALHVLILLLLLLNLVTCYKEPNPPIETSQGIEIAFGTQVADKGVTENPFSAPPETASSQPQTETQPIVEDIVEPVDQPLASEHAVNETETTEVTDQADEVEETTVETNTTPVETNTDSDNNDSDSDTQNETHTPIPGMGPMDLSGGSGEDDGQTGATDGTGQDLGQGKELNEITKGWGVESIPNPAVKESGEVTISVEFNRSGQVISGSVKYVSGSLTLFNKNKDIIVNSLEEELKFTQTDSSQSPKSRNKAIFRFEFKGH
jgi:hypothetical protein